MAELYAFAGRRRIGIFRHAGPRIAFAYDDSAGPTPISLSLPRSGQPVTPAAARAWLDNLLPAREDVRRRWARERGLPDTEPMTLLASYGDDLAGAISLSPDPDLPWRRAPQPVEAPLHEIATRLAALRNQPTSWLDQRARPRFSLGGHHGKFALRRASGKWLWPTYEHPSTHILRPTTPEEALHASRTSTTPAPAGSPRPAPSWSPSAGSRPSSPSGGTGSAANGSMPRRSGRRWDFARQTTSTPAAYEICSYGSGWAPPSSITTCPGARSCWRAIAASSRRCLGRHDVARALSRVDA